MQLRHSQRRAAKMRLALQGASGSGKTYSSLLLACGMASDWTKIAVIDTENGSADLYAHELPVVFTGDMIQHLYYGYLRAY